MRKKQETAAPSREVSPKPGTAGAGARPARRYDTILVQKARDANREWAGRKHKRNVDFPASTAWKRQTWTLPRDEARRKAKEFLHKYPKAAYWSELESWRVLPDDRIEFTMRRLPSAD